jgi:hypothetical protein
MMDTKDKEIIQMLQKKIGNLELTVHSMMAVLEEEDLMNQDRINRKAESIVKDMKHLDGDPVKKNINTDDNHG